jgi:hypothetical protein
MLLLRAQHLLRVRMGEMLRGQLQRYPLSRLPSDYQAAWKVALDVRQLGVADLATFVDRAGRDVVDVQADADGTTQLLVPAEAFWREGTIHSLQG